MLKDIPRGTTFVMRLVEPLKAGFGEYNKMSSYYIGFLNQIYCTLKVYKIIMVYHELIMDRLDNRQHSDSLTTIKRRHDYIQVLLYIILTEQKTDKMGCHTSREMWTGDYRFSHMITLTSFQILWTLHSDDAIQS